MSWIFRLRAIRVIRATANHSGELLKSRQSTEQSPIIIVARTMFRVSVE